MSFDSGASPSVTLRGLAASDRRGQAYGWGFAWYPEQSGSALVVKDPTSLGDNAMTKLLREWERFHSTLFICHLRGAARALQEQDTHPFKRCYARREWIFAHNGDLEAPQGDLTETLSLGEDPTFEPVGRTDSEHAFCWILSRVHAMRARSLVDVGWERLHAWFKELDALGTANFLLTDGRDLAVYADETGYNRLHVARFIPPNVPERLVTDDLEVDLDDARDLARTVVLFSTVPLCAEGWRPMKDGELIVVRRGSLIYDSDADDRSRRLMTAPISASRPEVPAQASLQQAATPLESPNANLRVVSESTESTESDEFAVSTEVAHPHLAHVAADSALQVPVDVAKNGAKNAPVELSQVDDSSSPSFEDDAVSSLPSKRIVRLPPIHHAATEEGAGRLLVVTHQTTYRYEKLVEKSFHLFRLRPVHDRWQDLLTFSLDLSVDTFKRVYEDVFGNVVIRGDIETPYRELHVVTRSLVRVRHQPPDDLHSPHRRFSIPLVWMPWQRQMMLPYLLPPELPETELQELTEFAMSFVERQDYDLVQTLIDMNTTIYRDFSYVTGSTTIATTPFQVFRRRTGVCQDFANLLICLARLLGVPARYRVGYIFTGADYENRVQSEASHAWAELYLPWSGWQGFDPTNGCLVGLDHIRVSAGRNYGDATPTSGTIYKGGGIERLQVSVQVEEAEPENG